MPASSQLSTIKARAFARVATTSALSSVAIAALLWASPSRALPFTSTPTWTFTSPSPVAGFNFGKSVALSGSSALIGGFVDYSCLLAFDSCYGASTAYLFDVNTGNLLQSFTNPNPSRADFFGRSVALSGSSALIGAFHDNNGAGAAYLFDVNTGNLLQSFANPNPSPSSEFGFSVALSGNIALIGDYYTGGNFQRGAAYLFDVNTGNLLQSFASPTSSLFDFFGYSIAVSGNSALIGAFQDNNSSGAAYLFDVTTGNLLHSFASPAPVNGFNFGSSVALSGSSALIGGFADNNGASTAYLFDVDTGSLLQSFASPTTAPFDYFGHYSSVALSDNRALIGDYNDNNSSGAAYLFDVNTGNLLQSFANPNPSPFSQFFGSSVALSDNSALIGANHHYGSAYLYTSTSLSSSTQSQSVPGPLPLLGLGAAFAWSRRLRNKYRNAAKSGARHH